MKAQIANRIDNIKKNYATEAKKGLFVVIGFVSGAAIAKGLDYLATKFPQVEPAIKYGKSVALGGTGFLLSSATNDKEIELKFIGYGLTAAGVYEGIKLIPVAKDYLYGVETSIGSTYYTENDKPLLELGDFGIKNMPVKSVSIEPAQRVSIELPDLLGSNDLGAINLNEDLGYNGETTADQISGIL